MLVWSMELTVSIEPVDGLEWYGRYHRPEGCPIRSLTLSPAVGVLGSACAGYDPVGIPITQRTSAHPGLAWSSVFPRLEPCIISHVPFSPTLRLAFLSRTSPLIFFYMSWKDL